MTSLIVRRLDVQADVVGLARRVYQAAHPALLFSADGKGPSYLAAEPLTSKVGLDPEPELRLGQGRGAVAAALLAVPRWVGVLPFEAERARLERSPLAVSAQGNRAFSDERAAPPIELPTWLRYGAVAVIDRGVRVVGDDVSAVNHLCRLLQGPALPPGALRLRLEPSDESESAQLDKVRVALDWILRGELYQVSLAHRLRFHIEGSSIELMARLAAAAPNAYCGSIELPDARGFVSTSPELFLRTSADGRISTLPIKGTRPRGRDALSSQRARTELENSEKERAELAMVVDVERNDLNRVCETGTVVSEPARIFASAKLYHRQALVSGRLRKDVTRTELLEAMLPSGSVTGAPKVRAMQLIAQLESARRGAYTGAFGALNHDGSLNLGMNIRCASRQLQHLEYWVGGGLVADSDPELEIEERRWKALQILAACE